MELIDAVCKSYIPSSCRRGIFQQQKTADEVLKIDTSLKIKLKRRAFNRGFVM